MVAGIKNTGFRSRESEKNFLKVMIFLLPQGGAEIRQIRGSRVWLHS